MSSSSLAPFKFTEDLDPTHFHCIRYVGPMPKTDNFDKSAVYYLFESQSTSLVSFVSSMAFTWTSQKDSSEAVLILPLWMKDFNLSNKEPLKFTKILMAEEFAGKLYLEFFGCLDQPSLPFFLILPELLGERRPLSNGTVLPFCWDGRRGLLRVRAEGMEDGNVFWFDLENGSLDIKTTTFKASNNFNTLFSGSWSDELKILKYHISYSSEEKQIFLICGVPVPLQTALLDELGVEWEAFDVSTLIPEEHLQISNDENDEVDLENELDDGRFMFIGEVEKISSTLMTEILRKLSSKSNKIKIKIIFTSSARSLETSTNLIQLEKSARRFNFQVNCCAMPAPSESERLDIVRRECGETILFPTMEEFKWTLNSMNFVDLMRLGRIYRSLKTESTDDADSAFKRAIALIKENDAESSSSSSLFTILSGKLGNFRFYGYNKLQRELKDLIKGPLVNPEAYERFGLPKSSGFLIHGPSGCGKTALCLNILTSHPFNTFFTVFHVPSASQLLSKYFGETEANIRKLFAQARERKPSILFIDQIETVGRKRGLDSGASEISDANDRYLSTLLNEMDGISGSEGVTVIACANHIELLDEALLRPGRLDRHFLLDLPDSESRKEIFEGFSRGSAADLEIVNKSDGWSGGEIKQFLKQI